MDNATDPLQPLRLFATIRQAAIDLKGLDHPDPKVRQRIVARPEAQAALVQLLHAAQQLVAAPDEDTLFWHPDREPYGEAEKRFEKLRAEMGKSA